MDKRQEFNQNHAYFDRQLPRECGNCGIRNGLHIHHIVPLEAGGNNRITNMVRLCERCHGLAHGDEGLFANLMKSSKRAKEELRKSGKWFGGRVPFGYKIDGAGYLTLSEGAETVRRILTDFYINKRSMKSIIKSLEADGILTPQGNTIWQHSTISVILGNTAYIGEVRRTRSKDITFTHNSILVDPQHVEVVRAGMYARRYTKSSNE
ncbi:recombinase family protein [Neobacillus drentensis]|uniref:recombinase family protein n=1 Tax=Neobacillus drentensis TaxID=220684 RepID=UPI003002B86D